MSLNMCYKLSVGFHSVLRIYLFPKLQKLLLYSLKSQYLARATSKYDCVGNFRSVVIQKVKDSNNAKSTVSDPHKRVVMSYPCHKMIFAASFGKDFSKEEKVYNRKDCQF